MAITIKDQMKTAAAAFLAVAIETNDAQAQDSLACAAGRVIASGVASWYGPGFNGRRTANGETYDQNKFTAAHLRLAFSSVVNVENLENGKSVKLRVNDRGPYHGGRILDVSRIAAQALGFVDDGTAKVRIRLCDPKPKRQRPRHHR
jgi:rare lipoprotein A (peptidoglycan hydrolase)